MPVYSVTMRRNVIEEITLMVDADSFGEAESLTINKTLHWVPCRSTPGETYVRKIVLENVEVVEPGK
jgi:hypothetical protein